jgi:ectoine hydroxylase-related dioxygenase (phytanoyl-CoA dioxygenase family)
MTGLRALTPHQVSQYAEEGFTFPVQVLSGQEVESWRAAMSQTGELLRPEERPLLWTNLHLSFRWAYDLATHPRVLDAVEDLLGPEIVVYSTLIFAKMGGEPNYVSWHQDGQFLARDAQPVRALTAWIALSPSTVENGCLRVVPASYRAGRLPQVNTYAPGNMLLRGETVQADFDESLPRDVVLAPGEMSLHHVDTIHGSNPNRSRESRIGFTIRFLQAEVKTVDPNTVTMRVRGGEPGRAAPAGPSADLHTAAAAHMAWVKRTRAAIAAKAG